MEIISGVGWAAVFVGAIVSFLVGWLWYSPKLFGPKWAEGVGVKMGDPTEMPKVAMGSQMLGLFLMSWFVAVTAAPRARGRAGSASGAKRGAFGPVAAVLWGGSAPGVPRARGRPR